MEQYHNKLKKIVSKSEKETFELARKLATKLKGGEVLALIGELGAGKTVFIKGLAKGLGVKNIITSPTFVLMKVYQITANRKPLTDKSVSGNRSAVSQLVHIDAYRLSSGKELEDIGALEYFGDKNSIVTIEWADRVCDILPKGVIKVKFRILDEKKREIIIT